MDRIKDFLSTHIHKPSREKYTVTVCSMKQAIQYSNESHKEPCYFVSIHDVNDHHELSRNSRNGITDVLYLHFDDVLADKSNHFTTNEAEMLREFVDKFIKSGLNTIRFHCHAGVSRSAALAAATSMYLNGDDIEIWKNPYHRPNMLCYEIMMKTYFGKVDRVVMARKYDLNLDIWRKNMLEIKKTLSAEADLAKWQRIWDKYAI